MILCPTSLKVSWAPLFFTFVLIVLLTVIAKSDYWISIQKPKYTLEKLKIGNGSQQQVSEVLGRQPWRVLNSPEAMKFSGFVSHEPDAVRKCGIYPGVAIYPRGLLVYIIYLDNRGKIVDFVITNN